MEIIIVILLSIVAVAAVVIAAVCWHHLRLIEMYTKMYTSVLINSERRVKALEKLCG